MSADKKQEVKVAKDANVKKEEVQKADVKKAEPKKTDVKKVEPKKAEPKKTEAKKVEVSAKKDGAKDLKHVLSGEVVSVKMDKTIIVLMERKVKHPVYGKYIKRSSRFFVHDESNKAKLGDVVRFRACKPYSKNKTWMLVD